MHRTSSHSLSMVCGGQVGGPGGSVAPLGCFEFLVLEMPVLVKGPLLSCQSACL
jgi:hypothetical protein